MTSYMLHTNTVSHLLKQHPTVTSNIVAVPMASLTISSITAAELFSAQAKRPQATNLHLAVQEFLRRVDILPWDQAAATAYGKARADLERAGTSLAPLDLLIAAHAIAVDATLVTNDRAFDHLHPLKRIDWTV